MLSKTISHSVVVRYVLQTPSGKFFKSHPAKPLLTSDVNDAFPFAIELLAEEYKNFVEHSGHSFIVCAVAGGAL